MLGKRDTVLSGVRSTVCNYLCQMACVVVLGMASNWPRRFLPSRTKGVTLGSFTTTKAEHCGTMGGSLSHVRMRERSSKAILSGNSTT